MVFVDFICFEVLLLGHLKYVFYFLFFVDVDPCMTFIPIQLINEFISNLMCLDFSLYVFLYEVNVILYF